MTNSSSLPPSLDAGGLAVWNTEMSYSQLVPSSSSPFSNSFLLPVSFSSLLLFSPAWVIMWRPSSQIIWPPPVFIIFFLHVFSLVFQLMFKIRGSQLTSSHCHWLHTPPAEELKKSLCVCLQCTHSLAVRACWCGYGGSTAQEGRHDHKRFCKKSTALSRDHQCVIELQASMSPTPVSSFAEARTEGPVYAVALLNHQAAPTLRGPEKFIMWNQQPVHIRLSFVWSSIHPPVQYLLHILGGAAVVAG